MELKYFLSLVGLNLITPLIGIDANGPWYRFAHTIEGTAGKGIVDVVHDGKQLWMAGAGLHMYADGTIEAIVPTGSYSALWFESQTQRLWFGGLNRIGIYQSQSGALEEWDVEAGYLWQIRPAHGLMWYFGSNGYGYVSPRDLTHQRYWQQEFSPRPFVMGPWPNVDRLFFSDVSGLWEVGESGAILRLRPEETGGKVASWMVPDGNGFIVGTTHHLYRWDEKSEHAIEEYSGGLDLYFLHGMNNAEAKGSLIAVLEYPHGLVFLERNSRQVVGLVREESGLRIGDAFKVATGSAHELLVLGENGVSTVNLSGETLFFPAGELYGSERLRGGIAHGGKAGFYTTDYLFWCGSDGSVSVELSRPPSYMAVDPAGRLVTGSVNAYEVREDEDWHPYDLGVAVSDLIWGRIRGYAVGADGIYALDQDLTVELAYPTAEPVQLLGEVDGSLVVHGGDQRLLRFEEHGAEWQPMPYEEEVSGELLDRVVLRDRIIMATTSGLYEVERDRINAFAHSPGWQCIAIAEAQGMLYQLYSHEATGRMAVSRGIGGQREFLDVEPLSAVGQPSQLVATGNYLAVAGSGGVLWLNPRAISSFERPRVQVALTVGMQPVNGRRLAYGGQVVDFGLSSSHPAIPFDLSYRINGGEWRMLPSGVNSLPFSGHGTFKVDLRPVFADGSQGDVATYTFSIAPPWYLNPWFQIAVAILLLLAVWGLYHLKHVNIRRLNLWLQSEVQKQTRELEAATAARTNFLAGLSHDIRNPLNGVLMITEALSRRPPVDRDDPRLMDLREFGTLVDRMLGEILDFSAIDQKGLPISIVAVAIRDIVNSAVQQNQWAIKRNHLQVTVAIQPALSEACIATDRNWMIQILSNLLDNAIHYSGSQKIEVGVTQTGEYRNFLDLEFYVKDWGSGIDDSEKQFIFERFYRGESGVESGRHGTGLGLSICRDMAHALGAQLDVQDVEPHGSCFALHGRFEAKGSSTALNVEAVLGSLANQRILVVDDLKYNRMAVVDFLENLGCICDSADNGKEALEMLGSTAYHMALLDWDLPGLTGPEIARRHRRRFPQDPVLLLAVTAYTDSEKKAESVRAGMNGYISKPLSASRLAYTLAGTQAPSGAQQEPRDLVIEARLQTEIHAHVAQCLLHGSQHEMEALRVSAHKLTSLAMMANDRPLQSLCRDIQIAARENNLEKAQDKLLELRKWKEN